MRFIHGIFEKNEKRDIGYGLTCASSEISVKPPLPRPLTGHAPSNPLPSPFLAAQKSFAAQHLRREIRRKVSSVSRRKIIYSYDTLVVAVGNSGETRHRRPCMPAGNTTRARHVNNSLGERRGAAMFDHAPMPMQPRRFRDGLIQRDNGRRTISETDNSCVYKIYTNTQYRGRHLSSLTFDQRL